jgi:hypothetical protein
MSSSAPILCEIVALRSSHAAALAEVAHLCARDLGLDLKSKKLRIGHRDSTLEANESVLTLHLPAALAASQHPVWCLACRLACFLPGSRISVLIQGDHAFESNERPVRQPRSA